MWAPAVWLKFFDYCRNCYLRKIIRYANKIHLLKKSHMHTRQFFNSRRPQATRFGLRSVKLVLMKPVTTQFETHRYKTSCRFRYQYLLSILQQQTCNEVTHCHVRRSQITWYMISSRRQVTPYLWDLGSLHFIIRGWVNNYPQCSCISVSVGSTVVFAFIARRCFLLITASHVSSC
jgi:hypothetical protein